MPLDPDEVVEAYHEFLQLMELERLAEELRRAGRASRSPGTGFRALLRCGLRRSCVRLACMRVLDCRVARELGGRGLVVVAVNVRESRGGVEALVRELL